MRLYPTPYLSDSPTPVHHHPNTLMNISSVF